MNKNFVVNFATSFVVGFAVTDAFITRQKLKKSERLALEYSAICKTIASMMKNAQSGKYVDNEQQANIDFDFYMMQYMNK